MNKNNSIENISVKNNSLETIDKTVLSEQKNFLTKWNTSNWKLFLSRNLSKETM